MNSLVLTGFMGSGKSGIGRLVAQQLRYPFFDLDQLIESETKMTISQIFKVHGESWFRAYEKKRVSSFLIEHQTNHFVLSLGGGSLQSEEVVQLIQQLSCLCYIKVDFDILFSRITRRKTRPLLLDKEGNFKDLTILYKELKQLYMAREPVYELANFIYEADDTLSKAVNATKLIDLIAPKTS